GVMSFGIKVMGPLAISGAWSGRLLPNDYGPSQAVTWTILARVEWDGALERLAARANVWRQSECCWDIGMGAHFPRLACMTSGSSEIVEACSRGLRPNSDCGMSCANVTG